MVDRPPPSEEFALGIDLGTTYSAAAILRGSVVEVCVLGTVAPQIPSVVVHRDPAVADGDGLLVGEAAERRAATEPTRTAREFKRRLGDPIPIIVGGTPFGAEALMAELLAAIVGQVTEREGRAPGVVVLTHPANYTEYKRGLLRDAARLAGLNPADLRLISEPEAAAIAYARQERIAAGQVIAVYDFGGGTFDAAVVRATTDGFELLGVPEGMERLGGIDFDQAVLAHVDVALDGLLSAADGSDEQVRIGLVRARAACQMAKEALSNDTDATIPVSLPGIQTDVRLTREEFELMVRPRIIETVAALQRTIASAGLTDDQIDWVLLVGGSSRMPIVAQVLRESLGRPVRVDADPKLAIAIGAAYSALPVKKVAEDATARLQAALSSRAAPSEQPQPSNRRGPRRALAAAVGAAAIAAAIGIAVVAGGGSDDTVATQPIGTRAIQPSSVQSSPTGTDSDPAATETATIAAERGRSTRLAFNGATDGAGIPGAALASGAPGVIAALATARDGDVYAVFASPLILVVGGGAVTIVATLPPEAGSPVGVAVASDDTLFISTPTGVWRITDGLSELVLDGPTVGLTSTLGPVALDGGGNLYISDNGSARIIRMAPDGALTLVAGTGTPAADRTVPADGSLATTSQLGVVTGLAIRADGSLLIADAWLQRILAVDREGLLTTLAGGGTVRIDSLAAVDASEGADPLTIGFESIMGLAVDADQNVFVSDSGQQGVVMVGGGRSALVVRAEGTGPQLLAVTPGGDLVYSDGSALWLATDVAARQ